MTKSYFVSGMVQGVGFRYFALREATRIGVRGWVRNLPDGRVEALAAGTAEQLDEFERAIRQGPGGSTVTDLHVSDRSGEVMPLRRFDIR